MSKYQVKRVLVTEYWVCNSRGQRVKHVPAFKTESAAKREISLSLKCEAVALKAQKISKENV